MIDLMICAVLVVVFFLALWRDFIVNTGPIRTSRLDARDIECEDCWNDQVK